MAVMRTALADVPAKNSPTPVSAYAVFFDFDKQSGDTPHKEMER